MKKVVKVEFLSIDASDMALERIDAIEDLEKAREAYEAYFNHLFWIQDRIDEMCPIQIEVRKGALRLEVEKTVFEKVCKAFNLNPLDYEVCGCELSMPWSIHDYLASIA